MADSIHSNSYYYNLFERTCVQKSIPRQIKNLAPLPLSLNTIFKFDGSEKKQAAFLSSECSNFISLKG